ncbi:chlorophyllase/cutinase-like alpha/beta fold protein [Lutimonas zeaxanthinifaciens]|uniref:alpha/beta hydrolase n=1 Tax=Lutimonas zeaxanthinifaciens TaxID=3060215 RepID=UPI00265D452B|nr:hypothetical protein [Lutimonas sp. YSD2104]WKK67133.1 hypothetical protein QZH61_05795 [Lutimonas sp. YSD2104]
MQYLEILMLLASVFYIVFNRPVNKRLSKPYVVGLLIIILLVHLLFEGSRWQMIPAYFIWLIALITALRRADATPSTLVFVLKTVGLFILLALSVLLPSVLPVFKLPEPTGTYIVGTKDIHLELDRDEVITVDPSDKRNLMIKAWYPSTENGAEKDPYVDKAGRNGFAQKYGLPVSFLNYLDKVDTHVFRNVPIADGSFPVLIFSHGYNSKANGYYALLSEIASQGYVVFALNHTYESTGTSFPDGAEAYFDYAYADKIQKDTWHLMEPVIESFKSDLSFENRHSIVQKGLRDYFVKDMVERWARDIIDVDKKLDNWNNSGFFKGSLDVSKVGVFGHSRGGGAAGHSLLMESRIKAGINLDGVQWGKIVDTTFQKPFLFLSADWPAEHENLNQHAYINKSSSVFYEGIISQTGHSNFMDIPLMVPLNSLSQAGNIDPLYGLEISNKVVTYFFDKHLKNRELDMGELSSKYEELDITVYKGDSLSSVSNLKQTSEEE